MAKKTCLNYREGKLPRKRGLIPPDGNFIPIFYNEMEKN